MADVFEERKKQIKEDLEKVLQRAPAIEAAEDKYVFFLVGVAAAAIAYGMQTTITTPLRYWDAFLAGAFLCWGVSFWAGCRNRDRRLAGATAVFWSSFVSSAVDAQLMITPPSEEQRRVLDTAIKSLVDELNSGSNKAAAEARCCFEIQFRLLALGAVLFFVWRLVGMLLR